MEKVYPLWAEYQCFILHQTITFNFSIKRLNLPYLQRDLVMDNKVNKPYYNQGQNQGQN